MYVQYIQGESNGARVLASVQFADPLVFGVTGLRHDSVSQITVHSTVPPVILLVLIIYEGRQHLRKSRHRPLIITLLEQGMWTR